MTTKRLPAESRKSCAAFLVGQAVSPANCEIETWQAKAPVTPPMLHSTPAT
jgi:hypothetical protein